LLNARLPGPLGAEIEALKTTTQALKATIHGTITSAAPDPTDPGATLVTYTGTGTATLVGSVSLTGSHDLLSIPGKKQSNDTFSNGSGTVTGSAATLNIVYTGAGHTKPNGNFTATFRGTGAGTSGIALGHSGPFTATLKGNTTTHAFTVTFTLRA
jgi:hypothetical protein